MNACERRLTARVLGIVVCFGACAGCGDDDRAPTTSTAAPDGGGSASTVSDAAAPSNATDDAGSGASPGSDQSSDSGAATNSATSLHDAATGETPSTSRDGSTDSDETTAPAGTSLDEVSTPSSAVTVTSGNSEASGFSDTSAPRSADTSAPAISSEADAAPPLEPDATLVQISEDFAGSEQGGGADGIDDATFNITLDGAIDSLLLAEADDRWQVVSGLYWWSKPGFSIPPSAPVLGGYTTEWNLYVEDSGYAQMTDRNMTPLTAGTHELTIYASWPAVPQPSRFVLLAFDDQGTVTSTQRIAY